MHSIGRNISRNKIYPTAQFPIPVDLGVAEKSQFLDCFHSFASQYIYLNESTSVTRVGILRKTYHWACLEPSQLFESDEPWNGGFFADVGWWLQIIFLKHV